MKAEKISQNSSSPESNENKETEMTDDLSHQEYKGIQITSSTHDDSSKQ